MLLVQEIFTLLHLDDNSTYIVHILTPQCIFIGQIMQPFRAVPSPGQYDVRKNVTSDESEWTFADDSGIFEEGKLIRSKPIHEANIHYCPYP